MTAASACPPGRRCSSGRRPPALAAPRRPARRGASRRGRSAPARRRSTRGARAAPGRPGRRGRGRRARCAAASPPTPEAEPLSRREGGRPSGTTSCARSRSIMPAGRGSRLPEGFSQRGLRERGEIFRTGRAECAASARDCGADEAGHIRCTGLWRHERREVPVLMSRRAWHPRYFGYPLVEGVVSWSGWGLRFTDGICPECATRFRSEYRAFLERRDTGRELATPPRAGYALDARSRAYLARVAELADAPDLGSGGFNSPWGFDSPLSHQLGAPMTVSVVRS